MPNKEELAHLPRISRNPKSKTWNEDYIDLRPVEIAEVRGLIDERINTKIAKRLVYVAGVDTENGYLLADHTIDAETGLLINPSRFVLPMVAYKTIARI